MVDTYNPLGTDGFEFVEYTAVDHKGIEQLKALFVSLGFAEIAKHRSKEAWLYRQGDINFIVNEQPHSQAEAFAKVHGPSVCGMAFRVNEATAAMEQAFKGGGEEYKTEIGPMELSIPAIYGIGESLLYFVDRYGKQSIYDVDFRFYDDAQERMAKADVGLYEIDHLTHNVKQGNMDLWSGFYERIGNFREIRYFDIEGKLTGLVSRAMTSPCGKIRIPINESSDDKSQIEEFIREYNGEGIQHIALTSQVDTNSDINGASGDRTLSNLDVDRVDEHDRIYAIQRASLPRLQPFQNLVGDLGDHLPRDIGPIDLGQVGLDLSRRQPLGV